MHPAARDGHAGADDLPGSNFDIGTGVTALLVAALAACKLMPRWLLLAWNALGTVLLLAILAIAVASLPTFAAYGREPVRLNTSDRPFPVRVAAGGFGQRRCFGPRAAVAAALVTWYARPCSLAPFISFFAAMTAARFRGGQL